MKKRMSKAERELEEAKLQPAPIENQLSFFSNLQLAEKGHSWTFETDRLLAFRRGKRKAADSHNADVQEIRQKDQVVKVMRKPFGLLDSKGVSTPWFPGDREYWVEKALRKLAVQQSIKVTLLAGEGIQVVFTIYQLRKELAESSHFFTPAQIKESLKILAGSTFEIFYENMENNKAGENMGTLLKDLMLNYQIEGDGEGKKTFVSCTYHPMVAQSIRAELHHPINHERQMKLNSSLAAWLVDRINQSFRQVERPSIMRESLPYHISLETILSESGMMRQSLRKNNLQAVRNALKDLAKTGYLDTGNETHPSGWLERPDSNDKDTIFELFLSYEFAEEIILGNIQKKTNKKALQQPTLFLKK